MTLHPHALREARACARIERLERRLRATQLAAAAFLAAAVAIGWMQGEPSARAAAADGELRLRRLVIEDEHGRSRIVLGAPVASVAGRRRGDPAVGLVLLDEAGRDRLQVGNVGGPQMGGVVQPRIAAATGVMICDLSGDERGGYGFLDNGRIVLGMDDPGGEGVLLFIAPDLRSKGLVVNESRDGTSAQRLFLGLGHENEALLKLHDGKGMHRVQLVAGVEDDPKLLVHDPEVQEVADLLER